MLFQCRGSINFGATNWLLTFHVVQIEFLKLVNCGDHSRALKVACSHLGPLATRDPALLKPLKETLFALLTPNEKFAGESLPFHALSTSLQVSNYFLITCMFKLWWSEWHARHALVISFFFLYIDYRTLTILLSNLIKYKRNKGRLLLIGSRMPVSQSPKWLTF